MKKPSNYTIKTIEEDPELFLSSPGPEGWWAWAIPAHNLTQGAQGARWSKLSSAQKWALAKGLGKSLSDAHRTALRVATDKAAAVAREYAVAEGREGTLEGKIEALAARVEELAALVEEGNSHGG